MVGPVPNNQDEPLDQDALVHQIRLLKSAHCCRPVLYQGKQEYINSLTVHHAGRGVGMTVWLKGNKEAIESVDVQIKPSVQSEEETNA